jgi:hypothetical protein
MVSLEVTEPGTRGKVLRLDRRPEPDHSGYCKFWVFILRVGKTIEGFRLRNILKKGQYGEPTVESRSGCRKTFL